jgi:AcrR family transcriptional regulator
MMTVRKTSAAAERIVGIAADLFYRQGYRATGINQVIRDSGVAKATFYNHFATKDDLCLSCLDILKIRELDFLDAFMAEKKDLGIEPYFLSIIESLRPWSLQTEFRGCGFINIAAEVPDPASPLRNKGKELYDEIRRRVHELCRTLIHSDDDRYGHLDESELTNHYMLAFAGAVVYLELYRDITYVDQALDTMRRLIGEQTCD